MAAFGAALPSASGLPSPKGRFLWPPPFPPRKGAPPPRGLRPNLRSGLLHPRTTLDADPRPGKAAGFCVSGAMRDSGNDPLTMTAGFCRHTEAAIHA